MTWVDNTTPKACFSTSGTSFAIGLALYWRINVAQSFWSKRAIEVSLVGLFAIACRQNLVTTAAASAFGLLLIVCYRWDEPIARISQLDPLRLCGRRSYAIYLIHLPVCTIGNAALAEMGLTSFWSRALIMVPAVTAASVAAGWIFYGLIDRRFGNLPAWGWLAPKVSPDVAVAPVVVIEPESSSGMVPSWSS